MAGPFVIIGAVISLWPSISRNKVS